MSERPKTTDATHRETGARRMPAGEGKTLLIRRTYDAPPEDVWDAITDPERLARWFLPVTGELRVGGTYQLRGNAGGKIVRCEPPRRLTLTWVISPNPSESDISEVEVRLSPAPDDGTVLELEHSAVIDPGFWARFGPGAAGVGWDLSLHALGHHLRGESLGDGGTEAWEASPAARSFIVASSEAWGAAFAASGAAPDEVASAVANTTEFYAPDPGT